MKLTVLSSILVTLLATIATAAKPAGIQYVSPVPNSTLNSRTSVIIIRPGSSLDKKSIDFAGQIVVTDASDNRYSGSLALSSDGKTLVFKPDVQYKKGEIVHVALLPGVKDQSGKGVASFEFQFTVTPVETALDPKDYLSETGVPGSQSRSLNKTAAAAEELPSDLPKYSVTTTGTGTPAEGYIFISPTRFVNGKGYNMVIDNTGELIYYKAVTDGVPVDFKVLPNGYLSYGSMYEFYNFTGGGPTVFRIMDNTLAVVDSFAMGNGYVAESHEFRLLPNGHALMLSYDLQPVDMSKIFPGGHPGARVVGSIIQELDHDRNVVFQWRSWDHIDISQSYNDLTLSVFDPVHVNSIDMDTDDQLLVSIMGLAEIAKISRQTGEFIWRLGGPNNQFTVTDPDGTPNAPAYFMAQHSVRRIENGNILMIDDGEQSRRAWGRVVEYQLDEINLTATNVWQYRPAEDLCISTMGSAQRLSNGNTLIGWGMASATTKTAVTEVDPSGNIVLELKFDALLQSSYRAYKFNWSGITPAHEVLRYEMAAGNSYEFSSSEDTLGIEIDLKDFNGFGYNEIRAFAYNYAPLNPEFPGRTPVVMPKSVLFHAMNLAGLSAILKFDTEFYNIKNPDSTIVYYRNKQGSGEFIALPTYLNPVTNQLYAELVDPGTDVQLDPDGVPISEVREYEFIFTHGDFAAQTFTPLLVSPQNDGDANIAKAKLEWSPVGFVKAFHLQVATDAAFSNLVVDKNDLTESVYLFDASAQDTATYYWRAKTINDAGESEWAAAKVFHTRNPYIKITSPNGGEQFRYGLKNFITWTSVIEGDVVIELYKDGALLEVIDTTENSGGYTWDVSPKLSLTTPYQIKLTAVADPSVNDLSDASFVLVGVKSSRGPEKLKTGFQLCKSNTGSFSATTKVRYQLADLSRVELSVYSILGQKVATLVNTRQPAGSYEIPFDVSRLTPAVYFVKFRAGEDFVRTRKLTLMK